MAYPAQIACRICGAQRTALGGGKRALCDEHFRAYMSREQSKHYRKWRDKVFDVLGRVCVHCGFSDARALQIDHINGGGNHQARNRKGGLLLFYKSILADPSGYQVLCANCNWIKRAENDENGRRYGSGMQEELDEHQSSRNM